VGTRFQASEEIIFFFHEGCVSGLKAKTREKYRILYYKEHLKMQE
jgi:hypothetical protein